MYWLALLAFWWLGIVSASQVPLGIVCGNVLVAEDIQTL